MEDRLTFSLVFMVNLVLIMKQLVHRKRKVFNDEIKKAINEKGKDDFLRFYSAKDAPDGTKIPTLKAIALKCEKREYKNVKDFINDIAEIKSFYKDKDPATAKKADEMYLVFKNITEDLKKKRKATSHSKNVSCKKS